MCTSGSGRRVKVIRLAVRSQKEGGVGHKHEHESLTMVNYNRLDGTLLNRTQDGTEEICARRK